MQTVTRERDTLRGNCVGAGFATASCQSSYQANTEDAEFSRMILLSVLCGTRGCSSSMGQCRRGDGWPQTWHRGPCAARLHTQPLSCLVRSSKACPGSRTVCVHWDQFPCPCGTAERLPLCQDAELQLPPKNLMVQLVWSIGQARVGSVKSIGKQAG